MTEQDTTGVDQDSGASQTERTDGDDLDGSIDKGDYRCGKQDRTTLSTTSSTPRPRRQPLARPTENIDREYDPGTLTTTRIRMAELKQTASVVALAGLIGLTSWAVASISTWLVPVYVTAIVLIFSLPQSNRAGGDDHASDTSRLRDQTNRAGKAQRPPRVVRDRAIQTGYDSAGASNSGVERLRSDATTFQHARNRARKPRNLSSEPTLEPPFASWVLVAPGKFVRADAQDQVVAATPEPHAPVKSAETSINESASHKDRLDETFLISASTTAEVDLTKPGLDPEDKTPSECL